MYNLYIQARPSPTESKMKKCIEEGIKILKEHKVKTEDLYLVWDISMFDIIKESGMYQGYKMYFCEHMQPVKVGRFNNKKEWLEE